MKDVPINHIICYGGGAFQALNPIFPQSKQQCLCIIRFFSVRLFTCSVKLKKRYFNKLLVSLSTVTNLHIFQQPMISLSPAIEHQTDVPHKNKLQSADSD